MARTEAIFWALRMIRVSFRWASNSSSLMAALSGGSKPWKAASKPGHLLSMTRQLNPARNTPRVISASHRSSGIAASSSGVLGRMLSQRRLQRRLSAPPLRRPRIDLIEALHRRLPPFALPPYLR